MLKHFVIGLFLMISGLVMAQEGTTSPYSFFGIGELKFRGTVENRSMGGISVLSDSIHLNIQNPAGVAGLRLVNYTVGASFRYEQIANNTESQNASTTTLDYIAVGIPAGKFGASFGLIPFTSVGYKLQSEENGRSRQLTGEGGLNRAFFTLAYEVTPKLSVGAEVSYNFGNISNTALVTEEGLQFGSQEINRSDLRGFSYNFGAQYRTMVSENLELSTSLTYTPETNFNAENFREISTTAETPAGGIVAVDPREIELGDTDFTFPSQLTVGAGIGQPKKWFIGAEYTSQKTSNFTNRTFELENVTFTDASKFRAGGYFIPNYNGFGSYWKRVVYRAGFRFEETGINLEGTDINEFGISFGVGLPVGRLFSNVNIGFEYGIRGTKDMGLIQENFFNTFISLSLNDRWFEKRFYE